MKKLLHTQGPWEAVQGFVGAVKKWFVVLNKDCDGILIDNEYDAKLMAAAPEMLEALIVAYSEIKEYTQLAQMYGEPEYIQSIIEKATGLPIDEVLS